MAKNDYTSLDMKGLEAAIREYVKRYYPNTTSDLSDYGFNSMLFGILSYLGEKVLFYQDYYMNEKFLSTANDMENILKHAKREGARFVFGGIAIGEVSFFLEIPASQSGIDENYLPVLKAGATLVSDNNIYFTLSHDVVFDLEDVRVGRVDENTGVPASYIVKKNGIVLSGRIVENKRTIEEYKPFAKVYFGNFDVAEVISVVDSSGNTYYEVDNLSQNTVLKIDKSGAVVPLAAPYRFVFERDARGFYLQFGSGSDSVQFREQLDDLQKHLASYGKDYISVKSFDPNCMIVNDKFGISPYGVELTIRYRSIEQSNINVGTGGINKLVDYEIYFNNSQYLDIDKKNMVYNSLECFNQEPVTGKMFFDNYEELKERIIGSVYSQRRAVSLGDYVSIAFAMPRKFGSIKRCSASSSFIGDRVFVNIFVASMDQNRKLIKTNSVVKNNLYKWLSQYKMISDNLNIFDLNIVNLGLEYSVIVENGYDKNDVNRKCLSALRDKYNFPLQGGQSFDLTEVYKTLINITGVLDVSFLNVVQKKGEGYSNYEYDLFAHLSSDGKVVYAEPDIVFEFKYVKDDISGVAI